MSENTKTMLMNKTRKISSKTVFSFIATLAFCSLLLSFTIISRNNVEKLTMEQLIMEKSMKIGSAISKLLYKTEAISAFVIQSNGSLEGFDRMAATIVNDPAILNILVAPSGVVSHVYPLQGNEAVIGLNFFKEGAGNKEAVIAKETGELVFGGPFNLVQGGQALVGRLPVFMDSPDGVKSFWGLVSVTLKYPEALDDAYLNEIEKDRLSYLIWRINPDTNEKQIITSSDHYNPKHMRYVEERIHILNAEWYFRIATTRSWYGYAETWLLAFIGLCISLLSAIVVQRNIDLKTAKSELENKVFETSLLAEELNEAKKQAEQASQAKSSFLANMNHEIRTPMSGIIGFAELAADDDMDPALIKDYLDKIKNSANGLLGIIDDILDISKIESGTIKLEKTPFSIHETLTICGAISNLKAMEKGLALSVNMEPPVTKKVIGDPTKLRQILLNLLSNAVKFTNKGFVSLNVAVRNINENESAFDFEVKDSGIGMSSKQIDNMFEPFTKADNTMTKPWGGAGLGLAIAKNLLELMGSEIKVESQQGVGSTFRFKITFEMSDEPVEAYESKLSETKKPIFKGDILVCEDNETNQLVIQGHLKKMGLNVTIAPDGKTGVEMVQARMLSGDPFKLIFMDIHMPVMDGLQAAKKLMDIENKTPVVALTANIMVNDLENYKRHGMPVYLGKPFKAQSLRECLLQYLIPVGYSSERINKNRQHVYSQNETIKKIAAIDKETGLDQYEGDEQTYENVLSSFIKNNKNTLEELKNAMNTGNTKLAHRMAHSLKGAAGTIGAIRLAGAAFSIERALSTVIYEGSVFATGEAFDEQMKLLENEFKSVFYELITLTEDTKEAESQTSIIDREKTIELIDKLTPFLEMGDSKSLEYLDEIEEVFQPIIEKCKLFIFQMEHYDFDLAYETMKSIQRFMRS